MTYSVFSLLKRDALNICLIFAVYSSAWIFLLFNVSGVYWDDWTLINQDADTILNAFRMVGAPMTGAVHVYLQSLGNGVFPYRLIVFISYFVVALCVYWLMKKSALVDKNSALIIALIVAVFPVNQARVALINAPYAYSLAIFFVAFVLMCNEKTTWRWVARLISLFLLFFSFFVMSLLVFYIVPIVFVAYIQRSIWFKGVGFETLTLLMKWVVGKLDYFMLPFAFFYIKTIYFSPTETYSGQNQISFDSMFMSVPYVIDNLSLFFWLPVERLLPEVSLLVVVGVVSVWFFLIRKGCASVREDNLYALLLAGVVLLFLAAYPYVVVGKVPSLVDWESRHQLLFPFGSALIIYSLISLVFKDNIKVLVFVFFVSCSVFRDSKDMLDYHVDSLKQDSIIYHLNGLDELRNARNGVVLFEDMAHSLNAMGRVYRFYEFNGWMKYALGDQTRLGEYAARSSSIDGWMQYIPYREYNFRKR